RPPIPEQFIVAVLPGDCSSLAQGRVMSSIVVPPFRWEGGRVGKCYNNIQEIVRRHGGGPVYGWALADFGPFRTNGSYPPPLYRRWLNHVVWRDRQRRMWEVSPSL